MATVTDTSARDRWEKENAAAPPREQPPTTVSSVPIDALYTPDSLDGFDPETDLGYPGQYPFTRGVHASMYRSRLWTMRQFAGFGTPRQTNERFKFLLEKGQTGLSTAFDLPTLMGLDSDDPRSLGEVGRLGVAVDHARRHGRIVRRHRPRQGVGVDDHQRPGHRRHGVLPGQRPGPRRRLEAAARHPPERHPQGVPRPERVRLPAGAARPPGRRRDRVLHAPRPAMEHGQRSAATTSARPARPPCRNWPSPWPTASTTWTSAWNAAWTWTPSLRGSASSSTPTTTFSRRSPSIGRPACCGPRRCATSYGAKKEASWKLRFHAQTAGCSLQDKQPEVNLIRVAYQALAAVLGGCQSLHTNSMDETLALPSEHAVTLALRTQQVLAYETGVDEHRRSARAAAISSRR